ncbi:polysaccharide biosynthesis/export family protein [Bacteroides sp. 519]|uniref:polysaccharide biosynthesis/export family protein n=1 Tax=Bacteroides sp. 519 TaxID=2302937 RepID=UPI0013CFA7D3|nr:polysaccharide biosynthesis/export family protein [Bacteroides sp. 519]NDV57781.1 polysaccharide export protein [Bacteroides sp. 519]
MNKNLFSILILCLLLASCGTSKKILYLQDMPINQLEQITNKTDITIQPKDMISIVVSSKDPQLALLFNLPRATVRMDHLSNNSSSNGEILGYTVDSKGNIDFPVLGYLNVKDKTREQLAQFIKAKIMEEDLIKDPVVTVDFLNLHFSVQGEVASPGEYSIDRDNITLLEAISKAGDLTIYGKRDGVIVIREENNTRIAHQVDLRSTDLFNSPAFYLKQNDVIYVQPNTVRAGQSTVNDNNVKSVSLWISIASFLTTLGVLIFK